jgi:hypothetical protein
MANRIHNLQTQVAERPHGKAAAVVMGLDVDDLASLDLFMPHVMEKVKLQRMCSPPDTAILFITLIGSLSASEFRRRWLELLPQDQVLAFFMSRMKEATVLHGKPDGTVLEHLSLFPQE